MKKIILITISCLLLAAAGAQAQTTYVFTNKTSWEKNSNWTPNTPGNGPGAGTIGLINLLGTSTTAQIGFNEHTELTGTLGTILTGSGGELIFGDYNSQTPSGNGNVNLILVGGSVNSISNTIIANESGNWIAFQNDVNPASDLAVATTLTLTINSGNNVIQSSAGSNIIIDNVITGAGGITYLGGGNSTTQGATLELGAGSQYDVTGTTGSNIPQPTFGGTFNGVSQATLTTDTNSFSGGLTIGNSDGTQAGVVKIDGANALPSTGTITVNPNSELLLNGNVPYTVSSLDVASNATVQSVSGGSITVGGTIGGGGTISAPVAVATYGSTLPGMGGSPAVLTTDLTYSGTSTAQFRLLGTTTADGLRKVTAGTDYDEILVAGGSNPVLGIGSNVTLQLNLGANAAATLATLKNDAATDANPYIGGGANTSLYNYFLFKLGAGTSTGQFSTLTITDGTGDSLSATIYYSGINDRFNGVTGLGDVVLDGMLGGTAVDQEFAISYDGSYGTNSTNGGNDIVLTVVPEPGTYVMALSGFSMLIGFRRMRRRRG